MGLQDERLLLNDDRATTTAAAAAAARTRVTSPAAAPAAPAPAAAPEADAIRNNTTNTTNTTTNGSSTTNGSISGQSDDNLRSQQPHQQQQQQQQHHRQQQPPLAPPVRLPSANVHQPSYGVSASSGDRYSPAHAVHVPSMHTSPDRPRHDFVAAHNDHDLHGDDLGPPRKRRRPALSCEPCRRRKVRCDRMHPCGPCVRMGVHSACEYDNRFPRLGMPPGATEFLASPGAPAYQRQHHDHQDASSRGHEDFDGQVRRQASVAPAASTNAIRPPTAVGTATNGSSHRPPSLANEQDFYLQPEVRDLQNRLARLEQLAASTTSITTPRHDPTLQQNVESLASRVDALEHRTPSSARKVADATSDTGHAVPIASPRLKVPILGENTTKFWGPTHYMHLFDPRSDLFGRMLSTNPKFNLTQVVSSTLAVDGFRRCRRLRQAVKATTKVNVVESLQDITRTMPQLSLRDELVRLYFRTLEELYGIFHAPSFRKQYEAVRTDLQQASEVELVQLLLVFAIGAVFLAEPDRSNLRSRVPRWVYCAQVWLTGPLEKTHNGIEWSRCWCLLLLARQVNSIGTKEQTYTLAGAMVRSVLTIGLHRDPEPFPGLSPFRVEMRRRLWCAVLELSLSASGDASMPPIILNGEYDCRSPLDVPDDRMDEQSGLLSAQHGSETSVRSLLRNSYILRCTAANMLNDFSTAMRYDNLIELSSDLDASLADISSFFSKQGQTKSATTSTDLHHKLLVMFIHYTQLDLHAAFLDAAKKDHRFHFSRHRALESATALLAILGNLDAQSPALDDLSKLTLLSTGVFKSSLSMKAIAVVCQELNLQLSETQTPFSVASREPLFRTLRHAKEQSLNLVKSGDPSCKRYAYLSVTIPMIEARQAGRPADEAIPQALSECLRICTEVMTSQLTPEQMPSALDSMTAGAQEEPRVTSEAHGMEDLTPYESMDFSFDPSWLLTAWHFGNGIN